MQVILIVIATILFTWSAWSGIDKGIKTLSNINMLLAFVVLIGLLLLGQRFYILNTFTNGLGNYIANFFSMSLRIPSGGQKFQWLKLDNFTGHGGYLGTVCRYLYSTCVKRTYD